MRTTTNILVADIDEYLRNNTTNANVLTIVHDNSIDLHQAIKNAVLEYSKTDDGKATLYRTCGNFTWGDFATDHNNDICKKYGFTISNVICIDDTISANESLLD